MRICKAVLCFLLLSMLFPVKGQATPAISAERAILIDLKTGEVLFEKAGYEKSSIASITKIMTAIIAIESGELDEKTTVSRKAIQTEGSSIYLEQGEKISIKDLLYGLMLRSGNDAAVAIAEHIGGSEEGFVFLMNEKAAWLGMDTSHFENPHGLDEEGHYSSAYDIARLTQYAMTNDTFADITGTTLYLSENRSYSWKNKHQLIRESNEEITGGKTGFTKKTGRTLVTTAKEGKKELVAVTLNAPDDWNDHHSLFNYGFEQLDLKEAKTPRGINTLADVSPVSLMDKFIYSFQKMIGVY